MEPEQPLGSHLLHRFSQASTGRTGLLLVDNKYFSRAPCFILYSQCGSQGGLWHSGLAPAAQQIREQLPQHQGQKEACFPCWCRGVME